MPAATAADASDVLSVRIDRAESTAIDAPDSLTVTGDFTIELTNAGEPVHAHLTCDDDLAPCLRVETGNHFIDREETHELPVEVISEDRPLRGRLRISVGYGAETAFVTLTVVESPEPETVRVDDSLAEPRGASDGDATGGARGIDPITVAAIALASAAVLGTIVLVGLVTDLFIGVLLAAVVLAVAAAMYVVRDVGQPRSGP